MDLNINEWLCISNLKRYIQDNRWPFLIGAAFIFIVYGSWLYSISAGIDTAFLVNHPHSPANWLDIGRHGGVFSRILFEGGLYFNPYHSAIFAFTTLVMAMMAFGYLLHCVGKIKGSIAVLFFLLFFVHPVITEFYYFTMLVIPASVGILLTPITILLAYYSILGRKRIYQLVTFVLMVWLFSSYQLFTILFGTGCIFVFILLFGQQLLTKSEKNNKTYIRLIIYLLTMSAIALLANKGIGHLLAGDMTYINEMVKWGEISPKEGIMNILSHFRAVFIGRGIFYTYSFTISFIVAFVTMVLKVKDNKYGMYILIFVGLQLCPFLLTAVEGIRPAARAQFVLPFVIACNFAYAFYGLSNIKWARITLTVVALLCLSSQTRAVARLLYTDTIRFEENKQLGLQIAHRLEQQEDGLSKPIAFVGTKQAQLNAACVRGELIGHSVFNHDDQVQPYYLFSSFRICDFLKTLGKNTENVTAEQMAVARQLALQMADWPAENSIFDNGDFIVVRLAKDNWPEEINDILWNVDLANIKDGMLEIIGWAFKLRSESTTSVWLINEKNQKSLRLETVTIERPDVENAYPSPFDYTRSGFEAKAKIDTIEDITDYRIALELVTSSDSSFVNTGKMIQK